MRFRARLALVVALVVLPGCAADRETPVSPGDGDIPDSVPAVVWQKDAAALARLDPLSLRPVGGRRVPLGSYGSGWSFSPDRSRLVLGGGGAASLRFIDVARMAVVGTLELGERGYVSAVEWPTPDRVFAIVEWSAFGHAVVVADPLSRRIVARHRLHGTLVGGNARVCLLGPVSSIGPSRIVAVDGDGRLRSAAVGRVRSGLLPGGETVDQISRYRTPALTVARGGDRAVIVDPAGLVAEIDLKSMAVRYRELGEPISLLGRLRNWLEPPAHAKASDGTARRAVWLGQHLVAVSGHDAHAGLGASGTVEQRDTPAGLRLIDTRNWTVRTLDREASAFTARHDVVLAYGAVWDGDEQRFRGPGLTAYSRDGGFVFRVFRGEPVSWVQTAGRYAYAVVERGGPVLDSHLYVVDLVSGRVLRELRAYENTGVPQILSDSRS